MPGQRHLTSVNREAARRSSPKHIRLSNSMKIAALSTSPFHGFSQGCTLAAPFAFFIITLAMMLVVKLVAEEIHCICGLVSSLIRESSGGAGPARPCLRAIKIVYRGRVVSACGMRRWECMRNLLGHEIFRISRCEMDSGL